MTNSDKIETFSFRVNEGDNTVIPSQILKGLNGTSLVTITYYPNEDSSGISIASKCSEIGNKKLVKLPGDGGFTPMVWVSPSGNTKTFKFSADVSEGSIEPKISASDFYERADGGSVLFLGDEKVIIQSESNLGRLIRLPYMKQQLKGNFYEEGSSEMNVPRPVFNDLKKRVEASITKVQQKTNSDKEGFIGFNPDEEITIKGHFLGEPKTRVNSEQLGEIKFQFTKNEKQK